MKSRDLDLLSDVAGEDLRAGIIRAVHRLHAADDCPVKSIGVCAEIADEILDLLGPVVEVLREAGRCAACDGTGRRYRLDTLRLVHVDIGECEVCFGTGYDPEAVRP